MEFTCTGHENMLGTHKTTLEFTHDNFLTRKGDCIIGINADFQVDQIKEFMRKEITRINQKIKITIKVDTFKDEIIAVYNTNFDHKHEMVIRKSNFTDKRTFATMADKCAAEIKREIINNMKSQKTIMKIKIEGLHE